MQFITQSRISTKAQSEKPARLHGSEIMDDTINTRALVIFAVFEQINELKKTATRQTS